MNSTRSSSPWLVILAACIAVGACSGAEPPSAPNAVPSAPESAPTGAGASGRFVRTGYAVTGSASLVIANGVARLDFTGDFTLPQTPGPVVYLNTTNNPNGGTPLRVGLLKSRSGAQSYSFQVPADVRYGYVLIWCDPFNVGIAEAAIPLTP